MTQRGGGVPRREFLKLAGGVGAVALGTAATGPLLSGCSTSAKTDTVKVGVLAPFSDTNTAIGSVVSESLTAAVKQVNSTGGVGGRKIELVFRDAGTDANAARRLYGELMATPDTIGILWCGAPGLDQVMPRVEQDGVPLMAVFSDLLSAGSLYPSSGAPRSVFQMSLPDVSAKAVLANYAKRDRDYSSAAMLYDGTLDPAGESRARFQQAFGGVGLELRGFETFATGDTDMSAQLERLKAGGAEVLYVEGVSAGAAAVGKAMADMGAGYVDTPTAKGPEWHPQIFGSLRDINQVSAQLAGDGVAVGSTTAWHVGGLTFLPGYAMAGWMQKFLGKYPGGGEEAPADALATLVQALKKAGTSDRQRMVTAVETMGPIHFSSAPFSYSKDRHNALSDDDVVVMTVEHLRGPAPTDPSYDLGKEWQGGQAFANRPGGPTLLVRPTLTANRRAHSGVMEQVLREDYGTQCTKRADGSLSPECKIH